MITPPLLELKNIKKMFKKNDAQDLLVLDHVNFTLYPGEIVALLGRSGSGKSTLLRIIAGLIKPTSGEVLYQGTQVHRPQVGMAMVFQNFALMPWLTVLENVELGLEAQGISRKERRERALNAIDIIGIDGFESAYPKELSGGMCQRVGIARALVTEPDLLLMDEAFSALDVLTSENLRNDLIRLRQDHKIKVKSILTVTHSIEEAVMLSDRICIFASNPGYIKDILKVELPHPRRAQDDVFHNIVDEVYTRMTTSATPHTFPQPPRFKVVGLGYRLPKVTLSELIGFIDALAEPEYHKCKVDLPKLADELNLNIDDLFPITEALEILHFAKVSEGDIELTDAGRQLANADILERKKIFAQHLIHHIPVARHIRQVLDEASGHRMPEERFLNELAGYLSPEASEEVLTTVIDWGRYAELFAYDYNTGMLSLENP